MKKIRHVENKNQRFKRIVILKEKEKKCIKLTFHILSVIMRQKQEEELMEQNIYIYR